MSTKSEHHVRHWCQSSTTMWMERSGGKSGDRERWAGGCGVESGCHKNRLKRWV